MCGLIGFFVGCDLKLSCPKRILGSCSSMDVPSSFKTWDTKASVRVKPYRPDQLDLAYFPEEFVPILAHSALDNLSDDKRKALQTFALFRFMDFTHKLEMIVVNTVTANIALNIYDFEVSEEVRLDAHKIYVDEAYHALFSFDSMRRLKNYSEELPLAESFPAFLGLLRDLKSGQTLRHQALLDLFFVIVSEMLITTTLRDAHQLTDLNGTVREMLHDHAIDEARHHAFYKNFLAVIWPQIPVTDQDFILARLPYLVRSYCEPNLAALHLELQFVGVGRLLAHEVLNDVYSTSKVRAYASDAGRYVIEWMGSLISSSQQQILTESVGENLAA